MDYSLMKIKHSKKSILAYHNDPSSHKDRNVKKYTYDGAASHFVNDLESAQANRKLAHRARDNLNVMQFDLQKPRDMNMYDISETANLKYESAQVRGNANALRTKSLKKLRQVKGLKSSYDRYTRGGDKRDIELINKDAYLLEKQLKD